MIQFAALALASSMAGQAFTKQPNPQGFAGIVCEVRKDGMIVVARTDAPPFQETKPYSKDGPRLVDVRLWGVDLKPMAMHYVKQHYLNRQVAVLIEGRDTAKHFVWGTISRDDPRFHVTTDVNPGLIYEGLATWNMKQAPLDLELQKATEDAHKFQAAREATAGRPGA